MAVNLEHYSKRPGAYRRAVDAGGTPTLPPSDTFFGDRYGQFRDPFGHIWALATVQEMLTPEQVAERMAEMVARLGR